MEKQLKATGANNVKSGMRKGLFRDKILKLILILKLPRKVLNNRKSFLFKILDDRKPTWKILPDKQKTGNYETQES